jgi:hypothetical protein
VLTLAACEATGASLGNGKKWVRETEKAARIGFPMGGSLDLTRLESRWGAGAAHALDLP